jgi:hypothetical protein
VDNGTVCSNVHEVVSEPADGVVLVDHPVPVSPIADVEFSGVEYGGVVTVWEAEGELDGLPVPVGPATEVELEADEREVAKPLLLVVCDAVPPVPVDRAEEEELCVG